MHFHFDVNMTVDVWPARNLLPVIFYGFNSMPCCLLCQDVYVLEMLIFALLAAI